MRTIKDRYYLPNNSVLVVSRRCLGRQRFSHVPITLRRLGAGTGPFVKYPLVKHPPIRASEVILVEQPVSAVRGSFEWQGPRPSARTSSSPTRPTFSAPRFPSPPRAFRRPSSTRAACTSASLSWFTQMNVGPISLSFDAAKDRVDACVTAIVNELPHIREPGYGPGRDGQRRAHSGDPAHSRTRALGRPCLTLTFWWTSAGLDYYLTTSTT